MKTALFDYVRNIGKLETETGIGFIRAETIHSFLPRHTADFFGEIVVDALLENSADKTFRYAHYVLFVVHERHFHIDLSEFGLTICAKVLVAEATRDLEITVEAAYHKKLFIKLRRLGKRVKLAGVNAGRNKVIARSLGGRFA